MEVVNLTNPFGNHCLIVGDAARIPVYGEIDDERDRQIEKWGAQSHLDGTGDLRYGWLADEYRRQCQAADKAGRVTWADILLEEVFEAMAESDPAKLRAELVQALAVGVAWLEDMDMDRRSNV